MEVWVISGLVLGGAIAAVLGWCAVLVALGRWGESYRRRRRDERRHAEQLEWRRRLQAGEGIPVRYETVYRPGEMVDEDVARMAELGYYVADEISWGDGTRKLVYRLEGVSAL
jgi:hypothetical protein